MKILIETSARHIHLSEKDLQCLFGDEYKLTKKKELSQPGQFVCFEKVNIVGPKNTINGVSVLGPIRQNTQVEVSLTDARKLGISVPVRRSGNLSGTPGCKLVGPKGELEIESGVIAAKRHIHISTKTANENGLYENQNVIVRVKTDDRPLLFGDVIVRVNDKFNDVMHIDTDESNAAGIFKPEYGEIIL